eukprot:1716961-Rhodomonas_salina.6
MRMGSRPEEGERSRLGPRGTLGEGLDERGHELADEVVVLDQRGPVAVEHVEEQPLDVRAVVVLVRHQHHLPVPQLPPQLIAFRLFPSFLLRRHAAPRAPVLQPENRFDGRELCVLEHALVRRLTHVLQLPFQRKHPVPVPPQHRQPRHGQGLGRVTLCQDQRAFACALCARPVCVLELWDQRAPARAGACAPDATSDPAFKSCAALLALRMGRLASKRQRGAV